MAALLNGCTVRLLFCWVFYLCITINGKLKDTPNAQQTQTVAVVVVAVVAVIAVVAVEATEAHGT